MDDMQVYIANLGKYNEGELVGAWFTFPIDFEEVKEKIGLNDEYEEYAMSTKTFDGKKPYGFLKSVIAYALRPKLTYAGKKVTLGRNQPQEAITAVRSEFYGISN